LALYHFGSGIEEIAVALDFRQKWLIVIVLLTRVKGTNSDIILGNRDIGWGGRGKEKEGH